MAMGKAVLAAAPSSLLSLSCGSGRGAPGRCSPKTHYIHAWPGGSGDGAAAMGSAPAFVSPRSIVDDGLKAELVPCGVRGGGGGGGRGRDQRCTRPTYRASILTSKSAR